VVPAVEEKIGKKIEEFLKYGDFDNHKPIAMTDLAGG
jgi:hypothetical protein